jgi:hypothetical protein
MNEKVRPLDYAPPPVKSASLILRRIFATIMGLAGTVVIAMGLFQPSEPARENIILAGIALLVVGVMARFGHKKIF